MSNDTDDDKTLTARDNTDSDVAAKFALDDYLEEIDLAPQLREDALDRFESLLDDVEQWADCDHDNVRTAVDPKFADREPIDSLIKQAEEQGDTDSLAVFHATCKDCGCDLSARLALEYEVAGNGGGFDE